MPEEKIKETTDIRTFIKEVIDDFYLACLSREASLLGRKEVLTGKAKFGIFGDGKELAQIAMAKQFQDGDFRSGYYRDQTFMMAIGKLSVQENFAALYAHADLESEPSAGGRQMGGHFATRSLNQDGSWKDLSKEKNSSADVSPTASQMPRLLGLALASKIYRNNPGLADATQFSNQGNEVAFGTIGDASTSEGMFFETVNAAGVLQVPMVLSIWDDGYGISVPREYQTTKDSISAALAGMQRDDKSPGYEIVRVKGWDYPALVSTYEKAVALSRKKHIPVLIHVTELTQPQGHSTSGSHERYKSKERLEWAREYDCIAQFRKWILDRGEIATEEELDELASRAKKDVREAQKTAWKNFQDQIIAEKTEAINLMKTLEEANESHIQELINELEKNSSPIRKEVYANVRQVLWATRNNNNDRREALISWYNSRMENIRALYGDHLYSESEWRTGKIRAVSPSFSDDSEEVDGRIVLRDNFAALFEKYPEVLTFGEDVGKIGGVNQSMENMQEKFGEIRVSDTGIRETTIIGQGIGLAMRGLRPIAEIQYLDYLLYCIQIMSDDLATVQYRTRGGQKAPLIVRTRGHRLEGIWHSGSPMGGIVNLLRGVIICVPRNMTEAAGFYNLLLQSDEPALVVEPLNGYRLKERLPQNLAEFTTPVGVPEIVRSGKDITVVSYGSTFNLCEKAAELLEKEGIDVELIDVRTLLPFDKNHIIADSVKKTNRLLVVDEDFPGGASGYILDRILNEQKAYFYLDSEPRTLTGQQHRPAYGSDGDYFSKPGIEDIFEAVYGMISESNPEKFPPLRF